MNKKGFSVFISSAHALEPFLIADAIYTKYELRGFFTNGRALGILRQNISE